MSEEEQLLAAIHAAPHEDTVRLAYADWLDDRAGPGDADRAAFVRHGVQNPDELYWLTDRPWPRLRRGEGARIFEARRREWHAEHVARLGPAPLAKWLAHADCLWAYRRGFVSRFDGTEQILADAGADLFKLGPIEEVHAFLSRFEAVLSLRPALGAPSVRVLRLRAPSAGDDCAARFQDAADWLQRFDAVELRLFFAPGREWGVNRAAVGALRESLANAPSLRHVTFVD